MAFDSDELKTLKELFTDQRSAIIGEVDTLNGKLRQGVHQILLEELRPIKNEIEWIKERLEQLFQRETEDVVATYKDYALLKRKIARLENRLALLEKR